MFLGRRDEDILAAASVEGRALVTYDLRTIPPLLRRLAETSVTHAGVILVSAKAVPFGDVRRLARALGRVADDHPQGLRDLVLFVSR